MRFRKTFVSVLALAIAIAFSPLADLRAAPLAGSPLGADTLTQTVKAEKKGQKSKPSKRHRKMAKAHHGKRAMSKGPGSCGTYMYYSRKGHKCMDARAK